MSKGSCLLLRVAAAGTFLLPAAALAAPVDAPASTQSFTCPRLDDSAAAAEVERLNGALGAKPGDLESLAARARALLSLGRTAESQKDFESLLSAAGVGKWQAAAWVGLGETRYLRGGPEEALAYFKKVVAKIGKKRDPATRDLLRAAHTGIGWSYLKQGKNFDAMKHFSKGKDDAWALAGMAHALANLGHAQAGLWDLRWALHRYGKEQSLPTLAHQGCEIALRLMGEILFRNQERASTPLPGTAELEQTAEEQKRRADTLLAQARKLTESDKEVRDLIEKAWKLVVTIEDSQRIVVAGSTTSYARSLRSGVISQEQFDALMDYERKGHALRGIDSLGMLWPKALGEMLENNGLPTAGLDLRPAYSKEEMVKLHRANTWAQNEVYPNLYNDVENVRTGYKDETMIHAKPMKGHSPFLDEPPAHPSKR